MTGRRLRLVDASTQLAARLEAAMALHAPCPGPDAPDLHDCRCPEPTSQDVPYCVRDLEQWPCSDWRALTGKPS